MPEDKPTIQSAIIVLLTVLVAPGVYDGVVNFNGKTVAMTARARDDILSNPSSPVVRFEEGEPVGSEINGILLHLSRWWSNHIHNSRLVSNDQEQHFL